MVRKLVVGDHHLVTFTQESISAMLIKAGFKIIKTTIRNKEISQILLKAIKP